jgi:hypothetical protein
MSAFRIARSIIVLGLTAWVAVGFATASRSQFLEPGKTAPAPEFRGVTQWVNSESLTMAGLHGKVVLLAATTASSQGVGKPAPEEQTGLKVGARAPTFTLKDQEGKDRSLDELLKKGKVALVFYRSADW